jgi:hypothetical protein
MTFKVTPDLSLVNSWEVQEETEILLISERPVRIVFQRHDLERGEVLGAGHRNFQAAGPPGSSATGEEFLGRLSTDVDEVQIPPNRIGVGMVRVAEGAVKGLIPSSLQPSDERVLDGKVDDQVQVHSGPGKPIHDEGDPADHGITGVLMIEEVGDRLEDVGEVHAWIVPQFA